MGIESIIEEIKVGHYLIKLPKVLEDSMHGQMAGFEVITVQITDSDGASGVGYTYTCGVNGGAIANILQREMTPQLLKQDATKIEAIWKDLWWKFHYGGRGGPTVFAQSAVDIALWDLKAKKAKLPLWRLLGGYDPKVPCYAGGIDLDLSPQELVEQTHQNIAKGHRTIKMKVGREKLGEDLAKLEAMRDEFGFELPLMVDANMKYNVDEAIHAAKKFEHYDLIWFEEPIPPDDLAGLRRVLSEGGIPIATGENFRTLWEFKAAVDTGGVSYLEPDVTNCGGITPFMKIAHLAEAHHLPVTSHGAHDITVHLLAACPNRSYLEAHGFGLENYIDNPIAITEGFATATDQVGHGINFDWDKLASTQVPR